MTLMSASIVVLNGSVLRAARLRTIAVAAHPGLARPRTLRWSGRLGIAPDRAAVTIWASAPAMPMTRRQAGTSLVAGGQLEDHGGDRAAALVARPTARTRCRSRHFALTGLLLEQMLLVPGSRGIRPGRSTGHRPRRGRSRRAARAVRPLPPPVRSGWPTMWPRTCNRSPTAACIRPPPSPAFPRHPCAGGTLTVCALPRPISVSMRRFALAVWGLPVSWQIPDSRVQQCGGRQRSPAQSADTAGIIPPSPGLGWAGSTYQQRYRGILACCGGADAGMEYLVVTEHRRARVWPPSAVTDRPARIQQPASEH